MYGKIIMFVSKGILVFHCLNYKNPPFDCFVKKYPLFIVGFFIPVAHPNHPDPLQQDQPYE